MMTMMKSSLTLTTDAVDFVRRGVLCVAVVEEEKVAKR